MTIDVVDGDFSPPSGTFLETRTCGSSTSKPKYDNYTGVEIHGTSTPGYHKKMRSGVLVPTTSWEKFTTSGTYSGSRSYAYYQNNSLICSYNQLDAHTNQFVSRGTLTSEISHSLDFMHSLYDDVQIDEIVTRALVELSASKHDTLTFLVELRKVVSMFRNVGSSIITFIRNHNAKEIANMWLQGRYGWRTLVFDLQSINEALEHIDSDVNFWKEQKGFSETSTELKYDTYEIIDGNHLGLEQGITTTVSYRGIARGVAKPPSFGGELAITAWEIVPFSFVIDWFINIGQKIALLSLGFGVHTTSHVGVSVTRTTALTSSLASGGLYATGYRWSKEQAYASIQSELLYRVPYEPSIFPSFDIDLDSFKVADIIALVMQALSKR